jgi:hypothetical protein
MDFFKKFVELIKNLFSGNPVDTRQRREFKRLETELRAGEPMLYKNGELLPAFAEAVYLLHRHTRPIDGILDATLLAKDIKIAHYYEAALFVTAFDEEMHELYASLDYDTRKEGVRSARNHSRAYEEQRQKLDTFTRKLSGVQFVRVDAVITQLHRMGDICKMDFASILNLFDPNFQSFNFSYAPRFQPIPLDGAEQFLKDFYRLTADYQITEGMARAVTALEKIRTRAEADNAQVESAVTNHLKKIHSIIVHLLDSDTVLKLVRLLKTDLTLVLEKARYSSTALPSFSTGVRETFDADALRIKTEIQDETVEAQIKELFEDTKLQDVGGYNQGEDTFLRLNTSLSFQWVVPLRVFKSFVSLFFDERAQTLLNDVAIEGFFNNPEFKTEFSTLVYNCCDIPAKIQEFENCFTAEGDNYSMLIRSYVTDSRRDEGFLSTLNKLVLTINGDAKKLLTESCHLLSELYIRITGIFGDIKKTSPDFISNVKILFSSIRNREKAAYLESHFSKWDNFFEIMGNYNIVIPPNTR